MASRRTRIQGVIGHQGRVDPRTMDKEMRETLGIPKPRTGEMPGGSRMGGKTFVPKKVRQPKKGK